jgi:hypothetical protein
VVTPFTCVRIGRLLGQPPDEPPEEPPELPPPEGATEVVVLGAVVAIDTGGS